MYICIYVYMYICIYVYMYICILVYIVYMCMYIYIYIVYIYTLCIYMYMIFFLNIYIYTYIRIYQFYTSIYIYAVLLGNHHFYPPSSRTPEPVPALLKWATSTSARSLPVVTCPVEKTIKSPSVHTVVGIDGCSYRQKME